MSETCGVQGLEKANQNLNPITAVPDMLVTIDRAYAEIMRLLHVGGLTTGQPLCAKQAKNPMEQTKVRNEGKFMQL